MDYAGSADPNCAVKILERTAQERPKVVDKTMTPGGSHPASNFPNERKLIMKTLPLIDRLAELGIDVNDPDVLRREDEQRERSEMRVAYRQGLKNTQRRKENLKTHVIVAFAVFLFFCYATATHGAKQANNGLSSTPAAATSPAPKAP